MARRKRKEKQPLSRENLLAKLFIVLLLAALAWRLHGLRAQVNLAEAERDRQSEQVEELQDENKSLEDDLETGVTKEKIEDLARQELGLVRKDEYVLYAGNG